MSKYIKLEDAIHNINLEVVGRKEYTGDMKANLFFALDDLPTIEVSDEQLSKLKSRENSVENTTVSEDFTSISRANSKLEVSEDCISRAGALKAYNEAVDELVKAEMKEFNLGDFTECSFNTTQLKLIARKIEDAPSVVPSRAEGEWYRQTTDQFDYWECSECGMGVGLDDVKNYCPNCGAKMKGADDGR